MYRLGFIGVGNMGEAILRGVLKGGVLESREIAAFDLNAAKCEALHGELGIQIMESLNALNLSCDMLLLAVKPNVCASVIEQGGKAFSGKALISIVTGWSGKKLAERLPDDTRVLRVMPNTPAMVGEGMSVLEAGDSLTGSERVFAAELFHAIGRVETVREELIPAVIGVSGSGPAYVYLFIEALADGGVRAGLARDKAYELAAQTVLGSAKMVLATGRHPGALKDAVCSPGGTTIEAVAALEHSGFRNAVLEAVDACVNKVVEMDHI